jgi:hypothetical protein
MKNESHIGWPITLHLVKGNIQKVSVKDNYSPLTLRQPITRGVKKYRKTIIGTGKWGNRF